MLKHFLFVIILGLTKIVSTWASVGDTHLILYYDEYKTQAQQLQANCIINWAVKTTIVSLSELKAKVLVNINGKPVVQKVDPIVGEDIDWTNYWKSLVGDEDLLIGEPRVIICALSNKHPITGGYYTPEWPTLTALTILGNPMEIPPSTITFSEEESDDRWSNVIQTSGDDGTKGLATDYYYGVHFEDKGAPKSLVPKLAVSRIPVYMMDFNQVTFLNINVNYVSNSIIEASSFANLTADQLKGKNLFLDVKFGKNTVPYYQPIVAHTATTGGSLKIVMTSLATDNYNLKNATSFPYIVNRNVAVVSTIKGGFAFLNGATLVDAYDPYAFGKNSLLVADDNIKPIFNQSRADRTVEVVLMTGVNKFYINTLSPSNYTFASLSAAINAGTQSVVLINTENIFAVTGSGNDIAGQYLTISTAVGDTLPNTTVGIDAMKGKTFNMYDMTSIRTTLTGLGVTAVNYIKPSFFQDEETNSSRLSPLAYIFNLTDSASSTVNKMTAWDSYLKANDRKLDYAHNALITGQANRGRWEYVSEHLATELLNYQDPENVTSPGLFSGFNVQKIFQSNDSNEDTVTASANRLRSVGEAAGDFIGVGAVGIGAYVQSKVASVLTDANGEAEIILRAPSSISDFTVLANSFYINGETQSTTQLLISPSLNYRLLGPTPKTAFRLVATSFPEATVGQAATVKFELQDVDGRLVDNNNPVTLSVVGFTGAYFQTTLTQTQTVNLVNGQGTVNVVYDKKGVLTISATQASTVGGPFFFSAIYSEVVLGRKEPIRLLWSVSEGIGPYGDLIALRIRVVDNAAEAVPLANRPIIFRLSSGSNKKAIDAVQQKGIAMMVDWWDSIWGSLGAQANDDYALPATTSTNPELPLMISAGNPGFDVEYDLGALFKTPLVPEHLFAAGSGYFTNGNNRGIMGYIGKYGNTVFITNQDGYWDKGRYYPKASSSELVTNRHVLARELLREYITAPDPSLGSLWTQSVQAFLKIQALKTMDTAAQSDPALVAGAIENAAVTHINLLEKWGIMGMAGQKLPKHSVFEKTADGLPGDVPVPQIKLVSSGLRTSATTLGSTDTVYDRYKTPVIEVPQNGSSNVTIQVTNLENVVAGSTNTQRGLKAYDPNIKFRYTLVAVPLDQPSADASQFPTRISEIDFDGFAQVGPSSNQISWTASPTSSDNITFTFGGNWVAAGGKILERGPGFYMVKVEVQEKARSDSPYPTLRKASFTKESRIFFKIANQFIAEAGTQFLLVNNTDHDPYKQNNYNWSGYVSMVPNPAIRYYEDALDNYQYNKGLIASQNVASGVATLTASSATDMYWQSRVKAGDRIRVRDSNTLVFGPWHRITAVATDGTTLKVTDSTGWFSAATIKNAAYYIQRSYSSGFATLDYDWTNSVTAPDIKTYAKITVDHVKDQGFLNVVQAGDFFKFIDGRVYHKITSITAAVGTSSNVYTLNFATPYPYQNIYHYYSNNNTWGGVPRLTTGAGQRSFSGSYSIYPANASDSSKPSYLYQTWNTHNFVTTNDFGLGLHGDVTLGVLDEFAKGEDNTGVRSRAVIWANDIGFAEITARGTMRDRDNSGTSDTQVYDSKYPVHFLSSLDMTLLDTFLGKGGRLLTGGQDVDLTSTHKFLTNTLGIYGGNTSSETRITKLEYDPISDRISGSISIQDGSSEGSKTTLELEANSVNYSAKELDYTTSIAKSFLSYGNSGQSKSAGIRVCGGEQLSPYAAVYYGLDFSTISFSGIKGETDYNDASTESSGEGRTYLMKKSIDWLRDPTITTSGELKVSYAAENMDGSTKTVILQLPGDKIQSIMVNGVKTTRVGPNQEIILKAQGGLLYGKTNYAWQNLSNEGSLRADPNEPKNTDLHQMIYKTSARSSGEYNLSITSPDGATLPIIVVVSPQTLLVSINPIAGKVINGEMIYGSSDNVVITVYGGDGLGTYAMNLDGDARLINSNELSSLGGGRNFNYNIPKNQLITGASTSLSFLVFSGDSNATATLTLYKPLKFDSATTTATYVLGGSSPTLTVSGGKPIDVNGNSIGYTFSASSSLISMTNSADGTSVTLTDGANASASDHPLSPTKVTVTATDKTFTAATATRDVNVYARPTFYYSALSSNTTTGKVTFTGANTLLSSGGTFQVPSDGKFNMQLWGGSGNSTVTIRSVDGGLGSTGNVLTYAGNNYKVGDVFQVAFVSANTMVLNTGVSNSLVQLEAESLGSKVFYSINFKSPIDVVYGMGSGSTASYDGSLITLKPLGTSGNSISTSIVKLRATAGGTPFAWSRSSSSLGGFLSQAQFDKLVVANTFPVFDALPSSNINQDNTGDFVYFVASTQDLQQGSLVVTDTQGSSATLILQVSSLDPLAWTSAEGTSAAIVKSLSGSILFSFTGGSYPYVITHSFTNSGIGFGTTRTTTLTIASPSAKSFTLSSRTNTTSTGSVKITDGTGSTLFSKSITFSSSSSSSGGSFATVPGTSTAGGAVPPSGGGGGGCLLP